MATLRYGLSVPQAAAELPQGLPEVRKQIGIFFRNLKQLDYDLLRDPDPEPSSVPGQPKAANGEALYGRSYVSSVIPPRAEVVAFLEQILKGSELSQREALQTGQGKAIPFATEATRRNAGEPGDLELLYDLRARQLLENNPESFTLLQGLGDQLSAELEELLTQGHVALTQQFTNTDAGKIAGRLYANFDLFDAIQFPMMFGTDVVSTDTVDIVRIAPEDAACLIADVKQRRQKLKGLAVAHFGAFLDRDWRVSDLLWGRLDAAERLITALLPFDASVQVRNQLIDEAQNAIFVDFKVQTRLKEMAVRQIAAQGPANKLSDESIERMLKVVVPEPAPVSRDAHIKLMRVWQDLVPKEMERKAALQSIARSTTIVGKIMESVSAKQQFFTHAGWLTNTGRAFWGVVEISVPRSLWAQLGNYWQWLTLLIAIALVACSFFAPQVSGIGWSLFLFSLLLYLVRRMLASYMRAGRAGPIKSFAALLLLIILGAGIWQTRTWFLLLKRKATEVTAAEIQRLAR